MAGAATRRWTAPRLRAVADVRRARAASRPGERTGLPRNPFGYALVATLGVGAGVAVLAAVSSLGTVLLYVGIALFLCLAVEPAIQFGARHGLRRWVSVLALSLLSALILVFAFTVIIPAISAQIVTLTIRLLEAGEGLAEEEWFHSLANAVGHSLDLNGILQSMTAFFSDPEKILAVGGGLLRVGTGIIDVITGLLVITALTVYFALTLPAMKRKIYSLVHFRAREGVVVLAEAILQSVGRYVGGQLMLAVLNAVVTFVLTASLGVPAPIVLATIAFVGALIPVFGTVIASTVTVLVTLTISPGAAIVAGIVLLIYMQVESYVLSPRVMSRAVSVPGALVIVAAIGGAALGGILGAFVAVPIAAAGLTIVDRIVIPRQQSDRSLARPILRTQ